MVIRAVSFAFLAAVIMVAGAQKRNWVLSRELQPVDVLAHFPLKVGNRWVYETKYLTGDPDRPHLDHWIWDVVVTKQSRTADGLIVFRKRRELRVLQGEPYDQSGLRADPYLITGGYVYELPSMFWGESNQVVGDDAFPNESVAEASRKWREETMRNSREDTMKRLRAGEFVPAFFFPMRVHLMWAERQREDEDYQGWSTHQTQPDSFYHWVVTGKGGRGLCGCMSVPPTAFDVVYPTLGGPTEIFFQDGVGVVGEWNRHEGTYWEETTTLRQFIPAPR
jgi:hypothetical protein